jgi:RHS repeat-associated protein
VRTHRALGAALATVLALGLVGHPPMPADAAEYAPARAQREKPVAGRSLPAQPVPAMSTGRPFTGAAPKWPAPGVTELDLAKSGTVGSIRLASASAGAPKRVRVETLDRAAHGNALSLRLSTKDTSGPVRVTVDYSGFRWAHGGDWASRLRLVEVPSCADETPSAEECRVRPLVTDNDIKAGSASAVVTVGTGTLVTLTAGPAGPAGDYSATALSASATWAAGGSGGEFAWSYPMRVPPSLGGPAPSVGLSYSSSSVDGRMAASNNQPSMIGEGFDWSPGAVTRSYVPCGADKENGANNTQTTGDQCWLADNATLTMAGRAGELVRDATKPNRWHLRTDDGTYVERRTGTGNGARDGEWWVATTTDGTQYWFGGKPSSNSTLTVPVYGNHAGEPCHAATFAASSCTQAYQWNLDHVVDTRGNTMTYFYAKETNKYARNMNPDDLAQYDRSGHIVRIEYGTRTDRTEPAPAQVLFETGDRCLADCATRDAAHWPDTPFDQECKAAPCGIPSPTFWSTRRLTKITTVVGTQNVEQWTLSHSFPDPGDGTRAGLWLRKISHTGLVAPVTSTPDIVFAGVQLANRVDAIDHSPAMNWWRVKTITTETGGKIDVSYSEPDCAAGTRLPDVNALQDNTLRCYPVKWTPQGASAPVVDFFHKYVVTDVVEADMTGGAARTRTHYDYVGIPAWHYTDDNGLVPSNAHKTWSVWRGYRAVRTTKGDPGHQTLVENRFFRGMHGDHLPGGARRVVLPAITTGGIPEVNDEDVYAGILREAITYDGPTGQEVSATVFEPWQSPPTASRTVGGVTVHARYVSVAATHTRTTRDKGRAPRTTTFRTVYDDTFGMPVRTEDLGDDAAPGDERCTTTDYNRNTVKWIVSTVSRVRGVALDCAKAAGSLTEEDVISEERTFYDGQGFAAAPLVGAVTRTDVMKSFDGGVPAFATTTTSEYDAYGRVTKGTDVRGKVTTSTYTPRAGGPVTGLTQVTNGDWTVRMTMNPAWGLPVSTVDANGRRTDLAYDGLGRLLSVWKPGRDRATQSANVVHSYQLRADAPSFVTTKELTAKGTYATTNTLYDSLLRVRQTQRQDGADGTGAVVTDTYYDTAGRQSRINGAYLATVPPSTNLFVPTAVVPTQTVTTYDGAGRPVASVFKVDAPAGGSPGGTERWRTTTAYGGDRTDVTPPAGGVVTSTVVDVGGRTTELRQYHAGVPAGTDDPAGFDSTRYTYNRKGQLTKVTDAAGNPWTYGYDLLGRRTTSTDPDKATITSVFDDAGDLVASADARNRTIRFTYDRSGRKTAAYDGPVAAENMLSRWEYDTLGNGTKALDQLVRTTRFVGGATGDAFVREINGFTADYQPTSVTYTIPDDQTGIGGSYSYVYGYHADGSLNTTRLPAIGDLKQETVTQNFDAFGRPVSLDSTYGTNAKTSLVTSTGYTSFGEPGAYTLRNEGGNTVDVTRTYETDTRRLAQIWTVKQKTPSTIGDMRYGYDDAGNVIRLADLTTGDNQCFRNDHLGRLTEAWTPAAGNCGPAPSAAGLGGPARYWQSYRYDVLGNRTSLVEHATPTGDRTTTYTVPGGKHQVTARSTTDTTGTTTKAYTYDSVGNMLTRPGGAGGTQTMTWDTEGRMATSTDAAGTTSFVYDADGGRLVRSDPAGRTLYLPGQELRYTTNGAGKTAVRYYSHAGQQIAVRSGAGLTWLSGDAQGTAQVSVTATTQSVATRRQTPFGGSRQGGGTWLAAMDKGFVGGTNDSTGLIHLGAREYDSASGRFVSRDPVVDTDDPQQMNGYAYSDNAPVTTSDPTGRLGSANCPPGFVGGPGACTGTENSPPPSPESPPGPGKGQCDSQHSASNCDQPDSSYKGPCDAKHSASNCGAPKTSPWDVISITWYANGTRLIIYRNGKAQINGYVLPDGVLDPDALAEKIDETTDRDQPDEIIATTGKAYSSCNPQICTLEARQEAESLHWKLMTESVHGGIGLCVSGSAFYGMLWSGEVCVYAHEGTPYVTVSGARGYGYDLAANVSISNVYTPNMSDLCGHANYVAGSVGPLTGNIAYSDDGTLLTGDSGLGVSGLKTPVNGSFGPGHGYAVWQFGNGQFVENIC